MRINTREVAGEKEVWACAYSTNNTEKSMSTKRTPVKGIISTDKKYDRYGRTTFVEYGKSGKPRASSKVLVGSRHCFDNEEECRNHYNSLITRQIDFLNSLIEEHKKDYI